MPGEDQGSDDLERARQHLDHRSQIIGSGVLVRLAFPRPHCLAASAAASPACQHPSLVAHDTHEPATGRWIGQICPASRDRDDERLLDDVLGARRIAAFAARDGTEPAIKLRAHGRGLQARGRNASGV